MCRGMPAHPERVTRGGVLVTGAPREGIAVRAESQKPTVLLVDDEPAIVTILTDFLEAEGMRVLTASSGHDALAVMECEVVWCVVLDIGMPGISGFDLCRQLRATKDIPIVFLTARDAEADKLRGFALGGDDYITKTATPLEIIARIKAVLRRSRGGASETPDLLLRYGDLCIDTRSCEVTVGGVVASLTAREYELLLLLAKHPRRLFSRDELFERLWGEIGDRHTVTVHIGRIRDKIERDPQNPRYVATIRGMGYRFEGDAD